jgi:hypothetical protein
MSGYGLGPYGLGPYGYTRVYRTVGTGGAVTIGAELWRSDIAGNLLEDLSDVLVAGFVDYDYFRNGGLFGALDGSPMGCEFTLRETARVTPLVDFLRPFLLLSYDDGRAEARYPLGLFAVQHPAERHTATIGEATLRGQDLTSVLRDSFFTSTYTADSGDQFDTEIRTIIEGGSVPAAMHNIRESSKALGYARKFTQTWSRLAAANKLAHAAGWYRLFAELDGRVTTLPYRSFATAQPALTITAADPVDDLALEPTTQVANTVILHARRQGRSTLKSMVPADDGSLSDPYSPASLGRRIVYGGGPIVVDDIDTQADLDAEAASLLEEARAREQIVRVTLLPQKPPGILRTVDLAIGGAKAHLDGRYACRGWRVGLTPEDALLELSLHRVVRPAAVEVAA